MKLMILTGPNQITINKNEVNFDYEKHEIFITVLRLSDKTDFNLSDINIDVMQFYNDILRFIYTELHLDQGILNDNNYEKFTDKLRLKLGSCKNDLSTLFGVVYKTIRSSDNLSNYVSVEVYRTILDLFNILSGNMNLYTEDLINSVLMKKLGWTLKIYVEVVVEPLIET